VLSRHLQPLRHAVDADHPFRTQILRDAGAHLPDRAETDDRAGTARLDVRVLHCLPGGADDVGEEQEPLVRVLVRHLDRAKLRLGHPQVLRLRAGHRAVQRGVAEQPGALVLLGDLRGLTLREVARVHIQQCPQEMLNGMTTRSPGRMLPTSAPTSSTMPIGS